MSLIDLFKDFHKQAIVNKYPATVRGVYDSILYDVNAKFYPEHCIYTQRELSALTGLSLEPLHRALKFLAERGHITVRTSKKGTVIRLPNINQTQTKHEPNISQTPETNSYIRAREDVKTLDVKTKTSGGTRIRELSDIWIEEIHRPLGASERYELAELEEIHGYDKVKSAIEQAKKSRYYPTFNDMKKLLKGGEKHEITTPSYTKPIRTGKEPWANF